jgi:acid phosphatase (class A)
MSRKRQLIAGLVVGIAIAALAAWWPRQPAFTYLDGQTGPFVELFAPPSAPASAATRRELDELLELQLKRTPAQVEAARADRKTEMSRFYGSLGLPETAELPRVEKLVNAAEDDVRLYVRAAKEHFRRLRPGEIEPRIETCIGNVRQDLSYPSGHSAYGYATAYLLADLAPEKRDALLARADEFARQRMVCGVHFRSDIDAGREAALWLVAHMTESQRFADDFAAADMELREALRAPHPR